MKPRLVGGRKRAVAQGSPRIAQVHSLARQDTSRDRVRVVCAVFGVGGDPEKADTAIVAALYLRQDDVGPANAALLRVREKPGRFSRLPDGVLCGFQRGRSPVPEMADGGASADHALVPLSAEVV